MEVMGEEPKGSVIFFFYHLLKFLRFLLQPAGGQTEEALGVFPDSKGDAAEPANGEVNMLCCFVRVPAEEEFGDIHLGRSENLFLRFGYDITQWDSTSSPAVRGATIDFSSPLCVRERGVANV